MNRLFPSEAGHVRQRLSKACAQAQRGGVLSHLLFVERALLH